MTSFQNSAIYRPGLLIVGLIVIALVLVMFNIRRSDEVTPVSQKAQIVKNDDQESAKMENTPNYDLNTATAESIDNPEVREESVSEGAPVSDRIVTNTAPSSIYPADPLDHYLANIDRANGGDVDAQYEVIRALEECRGVQDVSRDSLENELILDESISDEQRASILNTHDLCLPLAQQFGDVTQELQTWLKKAYENGHPVIQARGALIVFAQNFDQDYVERATNFRDSIVPALYTNSAESYLIATAYFVNAFPEEFIVEREAWSYLTCSANPSCETVSFLEEVRSRLPEHDVELAVTLAGEYQNQLDKGTFDARVIPLPRVLPARQDHPR